MLMNAAIIEHFEAWDIHNEGTTPSVKKVILAHGIEERIALRKALGYTTHHYPFSDHYNQHGKDPWMYGRKAHDALVESKSWREPLDFNYRYITEDVKCNLALMASRGGPMRRGHADCRFTPETPGCCGGRRFPAKPAGP